MLNSAKYRQRKGFELPFAAFLLLLAACEATVGRDDNSQAGELWRVGAIPVLEVGSANASPPFLFTSPSLTRAVRLTDGRIAVLETRTSELRYFAASGEHLLTVGGQGQGPGEFQSPYVLLPLRGDSVVVFDADLRRATVFDENGAVVSTTLIQASADAHLPKVIARLEDGSFLALQYAVSSGRTDRETGWVWRMSRDGAPIARVSPWEGALLESEEAIPFQGGNPYPVWNGSVIHGDRFTNEFRAYDLNGTVTQEFAGQGEPDPITDDDIAELLDWMLNTAQSESRREEIERLFENPRLPETHPAFGPLVVDRMGNLWVGNFNPRPDGQLNPGGRPLPRDVPEYWSVFDPSGVWISDVTMPEGFLPRDIGQDYVLGVATGDFDVPYIRMYALAMQ